MDFPTHLAIFPMAVEMGYTGKIPQALSGLIPKMGLILSPVGLVQTWFPASGYHLNLL